MATAIETELLRVMRLVQKGLRSGHIKDQTLMYLASPNAAEMTMESLSSIVDAAIAKAESA